MSDMLPLIYLNLGISLSLRHRPASGSGSLDVPTWGRPPPVKVHAMVNTGGLALWHCRKPSPDHILRITFLIGIDGSRYSVPGQWELWEIVTAMAFPSFQGRRRHLQKPLKTNLYRVSELCTWLRGMQKPPLPSSRLQTTLTCISQP